MKKKILGGIAVLAIAVVAAFNVNISVQENGLSDISLDNVEALAGEGSSRLRIKNMYWSGGMGGGMVTACSTGGILIC